jgi:hypothetical protein
VDGHFARKMDQIKTWWAKSGVCIDSCLTRLYPEDYISIARAADIFSKYGVTGIPVGEGGAYVTLKGEALARSYAYSDRATSALRVTRIVSAFKFLSGASAVISVAGTSAYRSAQLYCATVECAR